MPRPRRFTASKAVSYVDDASDGDEGPEKAPGGREEGSANEREWATGEAESDGDDYRDEDEPAPKKRKVDAASAAGTVKSTAKGKGKGRQGKLAAFQALPLDVLCETASYLDPLTLLHMSRSSKMLHSLLASRSAAGIWQSARRLAGLEGQLKSNQVTEMQVASLLYERNCHICGVGRASIVDYSLRVRWCKSCQRSNLMLETKLKKEIHYRRYQNQKPYYNKADVKKTNKKLIALRQAISGSTAERAEPARRFTEWHRARKEDVKVGREDSKLLLEWEVAGARVRRDQAQANSDARREAIEQRLLDLGYDKRDMTRLYADGVNQPTALTDTIWTRIKNGIIANVETNHQQRLEKEARLRRFDRQQALRPYYVDLVSHAHGDRKTYFPVFEHFAHLTDVMPLWVPENADLSSEAWEAAQPAIEQNLVRAVWVARLDWAPIVSRALVDSGIKVDSALRQKLGPPVHPYIDYSYHPTEGNVKQHIVKLYSDDPTPEVTEADLDSILSRFLAVRCSNYACSIIASLDDFQAHLRTTPTRNSVYGMSYNQAHTATLPTWLIKLLSNVLHETGLEDKPSTFETLDALGPVFECDDCITSLNSSRSLYYQQPANPPSSSGFTFREICQHTNDYHERAFAYSTSGFSTHILPKVKLLPAGREKLEELRSSTRTSPATA
ncbi:hypothetical protein JCM8097_008252 [Rhodosporidiobolus ruineniae]